MEELASLTTAGESGTVWSPFEYGSTSGPEGPKVPAVLDEQASVVAPRLDLPEVNIQTGEIQLEIPGER